MGSGKGKCMIMIKGGENDHFFHRGEVINGGFGLVLDGTQVRWYFIIVLIIILTYCRLLEREHRGCCTGM